MCQRGTRSEGRNASGPTSMVKRQVPAVEGEGESKRSVSKGQRGMRDALRQVRSGQVRSGHRPSVVCSRPFANARSRLRSRLSSLRLRQRTRLLCDSASTVPQASKQRLTSRTGARWLQLHGSECDSREVPVAACAMIKDMRTAAPAEPTNSRVLHCGGPCRRHG